MYETGSGVPKDDSKAADWYLKSVEVPPNGRFHAEPIETLVAQLYRDARGVSQSYADAAKWYRTAAERGFAPAQEGLASLYIKGHGVPQDFVLAYMWLNLAATGTSDENILGRRDALAALMTPDQVAEGQKMTREWKPAR
jgi:TPR repeat protein